jgi:hypothetical protein
VNPVAPWHFTTWLDLFDHWQTVIAGALALAAAFGTIAVTMVIARKQIVASREEADRVIAATRDQTKVTAEQTATTVRLEQDRVASEALAFSAMLDAAMVRVLNEVDWARKTYPQTLSQQAGASVEALVVRQCITKGGFAELRAACVRHGGPFTREFLDLEREIDSFARQWEDRPMETDRGVIIREGKHAGLGKQLHEIGEKANTLRLKIAERN